MSKAPVTKSFSDSHQKASESFLLETKYVVLNFMGLPPTELSEGLTSSQTSYASDHKKSSSYPAYPQIILPPKKELPAKARTKRITNEAESSSPMSSTSQKRYPTRARKKFTDSERKKDKESEKDEHREASEFALPDSTQENSSPPYFFPSVSQTQSELSDNSSYCSDADDEGGSTSNCSSTVSSRCNSGDLRYIDFGAVDLLHAVSRLPTVVSESELEKEEGNQDTSPTYFENVRIPDFTPSTLHDIDDIPATDSPLAPTMQHQDEDGHVTGDWDLTQRHLIDSTSSFSELAHINDVETDDTMTRGIGNRANLRLDFGGQHTWEMLQTELQSEFSSLESEVEDAIKNHKITPAEALLTTPLSPQSEVAKKIAHIGDEVRLQYGSQLDMAITDLFTAQAASITYDSFRHAASYFLDEKIVELKQVALVLVFSQKVAWKLLESGKKSFANFGDLVDYSTQLIADYAAEYIIKHGGWAALSSSDHTSSSPLTTPEYGSPFMKHADRLDVSFVKSSSTHPLASSNPLVNKESKAIAQQIGRSLSMDPSNEKNNNYLNKHSDSSFISSVSEFIQSNKLNFAVLSLFLILGVYVVKKRKT